MHGGPGIAATGRDRVGGQLVPRRPGRRERQRHQRSAALAPPAIVCPTNAATVTVQGYGSAEAQPNELVISLGVQTQASTAAVALGTNSARPTP